MLLKQFFTTDEYLKIMINNVQHISNEQDEIEIYIPLKSFQIAGIKKIKGIFNGLQVQIMLSKAFQAKKDIDTLYALDIISAIPAPIIKKKKVEDILSNSFDSLITLINQEFLQIYQENNQHSLEHVHQRKQLLYYKLNTSNEYYKIKEMLKISILKVLKSINNQTIEVEQEVEQEDEQEEGKKKKKKKNHLSQLRILSKVYHLLTTQMHQAINNHHLNQQQIQHNEHHINQQVHNKQAKYLYRKAYQAELLDDYSLATISYNKRINLPLSTTLKEENLQIYYVEKS